MVNTLRGSDSSPAYSRGNTFPAVALPFGFNLWTPITEGNSERWLYRYRARTIQGFAVSHEPSPWIGEHASIQVMPMTGTVRTAPSARASAFSHTREEAKPYYYKVKLDDSGVTTEIAPTDHASAWRFTFSNSDKAFVLFDIIDSAAGSISVNQAERTVQGYVNQNGPRMYFFAKIDRDIPSFGTGSGKGASGWIQLDVRARSAVTMTMATSFIGISQAQANLIDEIGSKSFDQVRTEAQSAWDGLLGRIEVSGGTDEQRVTFYSNLYRVFLYPNSMWERENGRFEYFSPYTGRLQQGKTYVDNGFWDTYRAVWPLFSLLIPTQAGAMLGGFVNAFLDGGWVPRWSGPGYIDCMVGSHSDIVFADSYLRGVTNFDVRAAYASMLKNAMAYSDSGARGRKGNERSIFLGYVPTDLVGYSGLWTLEDAINDFGIAEIAQILGDRANYEYFSNRSLRYALLYSPSVGFFRGRRTDGNWRTSDASFAPNEWGYEFVEGSPWQYSTAAATDPQGLANLLGGQAQLSAKVDSMLRAPRAFRTGSYGQTIHEMREGYDADMGQYAHPNEPVHSTLYMYDYAGAPYKTQTSVRDVLERLYKSGIGSGDGYLGDEDNGQMSAWYLFSAMGFYPASPGHPEYAIGSPLFESVTIHLESGKLFRVLAKHNSHVNRYIQSAKLNGVVYSKNYLTHAAIVQGGTLEFEMGSTPSRWGTAKDALPTSITPVASDRVPALRVDRAQGGTVTASSENLADHADATRAFDDNSLTKWQALEQAPSIYYRFASNRKYTVGLYTVTSAGDSPERDPKDWTLQGSDDCTRWLTIDTRANEVFPWRNYTKAYLAKNTTPYACYRLAISGNHGAPVTQVAEIELIGDAPIAVTTAHPTAGCGPNMAADKATDGSLYSKWCSKAASPSLEVNLGGSYAVTQFVIYHAQSGGELPKLNTRDFNIDLSPDGQNWTRIAAVTGNQDGITQHTIQPTRARAARLSIVKPNQGVNGVARIYEVEVYGKPVTAR